MDDQNAQWVRAAVEKLSDHVVVVFVTHRPQLLQGFDRVLLVHGQTAREARLNPWLVPIDGGTPIALGDKRADLARFGTRHLTEDNAPQMAAALDAGIYQFNVESEPELDALNDVAVIERLAGPRFLPTHLEVDRSPELADTHLGSRGIPMTYALRNGTVIATLRGQRSAADLLAWLEALPE